ncbi:sulfatase-like hydrolase/transferase [Verrucomicrobium spinosum]|uniref:sulfatase-like hydrolase/transferase n=1 Tax=Verrucomicrobium spinosum TaxID=2736 RepID=UPI000B005FE8|nr:sulfatase-like hydrolase/transferase [Verrucomicrobium spinosum]
MPWKSSWIPVLAAVVTVAASLQASARPNVIVFLADDLGYGELGCYGQKKIKTPNLDQLAADGMRFTDFYSGHAVCAPPAV